MKYFKYIFGKITGEGAVKNTYSLKIVFEFSEADNPLCLVNEFSDLKDYVDTNIYINIRNLVGKSAILGLFQFGLSSDQEEEKAKCFAGARILLDLMTDENIVIKINSGEVEDGVISNLGNEEIAQVDPSVFNFVSIFNDNNISQETLEEQEDVENDEMIEEIRQLSEEDNDLIQ